MSHLLTMVLTPAEFNNSNFGVSAVVDNFGGYATAVYVRCANFDTVTFAYH